MQLFEKRKIELIGVAGAVQIELYHAKILGWNERCHGVSLPRTASRTIVVSRLDIIDLSDFFLAMPLLLYCTVRYLL